MEKIAELIFEDPEVDKHLTRVAIGICVLAVIYMGWHLYRGLPILMQLQGVLL